MRRSAFTTVIILVEVLIALSATADTPRGLPPPRWHVSISPLFSKHPEDTRITSVSDVILVSHYPAVIAVNRTSGRELWRRGESDSDSANLPRTTIGWQLLSSGSVDGVGPVALLLEIRGITKADSTFPSGQHSVADYSEVALNANTGQVLWSSPSDVYCKSTLVGNLVVNINHVEAPGKVKTLLYRDAAAGAALDAADTHGAAAIQRAVRHQGKDSVLIGDLTALWSLNIATGTATNLHNATGYLLNYWAFPDQQRVVMHNNADDDVPGQSTFPKYVECVDLTGAVQWSFPKDLEFISADKIATIPELYSIFPMTPCRACCTVLCVNDKVGRNGRFSWYGLDVRYGKVLWKSAIVDEPPVIAECGAGFLVVAYRDTARGKVNLEWMDGQTGKLARIGPAPDAAMMAVDGSDLFVVATDGKLSAYPLETLLPAAAKKRLAAVTRRSSN